MSPVNSDTYVSLGEVTRNRNGSNVAWIDQCFLSRPRRIVIDPLMSWLYFTSKVTFYRQLNAFSAASRCTLAASYRLTVATTGSYAK